MSYRRCGRNLQAKLDTVISPLSANHAYLKTLYTKLCCVVTETHVYVNNVALGRYETVKWIVKWNP